MPYQVSLRTLLIITTLIGVSVMIAGLLFTGIVGGTLPSAAHRLNLLPFIVAGSMAPLGVPLLIYWGLRIYEWWEKRQRGDSF